MTFEIIYFDGGFGVVKDGLKIYSDPNYYYIEKNDGSVVKFLREEVKVIRPFDA